jgi:hypothetical protein
MLCWWSLICEKKGSRLVNLAGYHFVMGIFLDLKVQGFTQFYIKNIIKSRCLINGNVLQAMT